MLWTAPKDNPSRSDNVLHYCMTSHVLCMQYLLQSLCGLQLQLVPYAHMWKSGQRKFQRIVLQVASCLLLKGVMALL